MLGRAQCLRGRGARPLVLHVTRSAAPTWRTPVEGDRLLTPRHTPPEARHSTRDQLREEGSSADEVHQRGMDQTASSREQDLRSCEQSCRAEAQRDRGRGEPQDSVIVQRSRSESLRHWLQSGQSSQGQERLPTRTLRHNRCGHQEWSLDRVQIPLVSRMHRGFNDDRGIALMEASNDPLEGASCVVAK